MFLDDSPQAAYSLTSKSLFWKGTDPPMQTPCKVLIADGLSAEGIEQMKANSAIELMVFDAIPREDLKKMMGSVDILIVRSRTQVDRDLLEHAKHLKIVLRAGIGIDNIEIPAATDLGIVVMNAPTGNIVTTAEHAIGMIFAVSRHIPQADASMRLGKWDRKKYQGNELRNKTLGLVGLGNIGKVVADRCRALGMKVVAFDPYLTAEAAAKQGVELTTFEGLLEVSDYISFHVPLTEQTRHLLNRETFKKVKPGVYIINCARGGVIDEMALAEALESKQVAGAALDVFEKEPPAADHPLLKRADVVLTPHLGASTDEAQLQVSFEVADQVNEYIRNGVVKNAINVPNITLEQMKSVKPYLSLSEKLGGFVAQVLPHTTVKKVSIRYEGTITEFNREVLTLSVLKGFLSHLMAMSINFVNAKNVLRERGIRVEESFDAQCEDYASLITLTVESEGSTTSCSGTLFGKEEPRIVVYDQFAIDAVPSGVILVTRNSDQPGVIGAMGSILGQEKVNIARMHLGRNKSRTEAVALINLDSKLESATQKKLEAIPGMLSVRQITL